MRGWGLLLLAKVAAEGEQYPSPPFRGADFLPEGDALSAMRENLHPGIR